MIKRIDLTFQSTEVYEQTNHPHLENLKALKPILPVPEVLLRPLGKYNLPYETNDSETINFHGQRTVIYLHGQEELQKTIQFSYRQIT